MIYDLSDTEMASRIIELVSKTTGFAIPLLLSKWRKREVVFARMMCSHLISIHTKLSLKSIGKMIGGVDHSTIIHHKQTVLDLMETDKKIREQVNILDKRIELRSF